jgi:hypothetical protein
MNANMTTPRCLVDGIDADHRFRPTSRSRKNGFVSLLTTFRREPDFPGPELTALAAPVRDWFSTSVIVGPTQAACQLLAAAHFCGMALPNAIQPCRESPDRIHLRA